MQLLDIVKRGDLQNVVKCNVFHDMRTGHNQSNILWTILTHLIPEDE